MIHFWTNSTHSSLKMESCASTAKPAKRSSNAKYCWVKSHKNAIKMSVSIASKELKMIAVNAALSISIISSSRAKSKPALNLKTINSPHSSTKNRKLERTNIFNISTMILSTPLPFSTWTRSPSPVGSPTFKWKVESDRFSTKKSGKNKSSLGSAQPKRKPTFCTGKNTPRKLESTLAATITNTIKELT